MRQKGTVIIGSYELQVLVADRPVKEYGYQGKTFIEGRSGSAFSVKFRNSSPSRILAVPSVDGLCSIDGLPATPASRGYVVPAYTAIELKGWRKDLSTSADFVFTERAKSYAAQTAGSQNLGVIAVKVFAEVFKAPAVLPASEQHHHYHYHQHCAPLPRPEWVVYGSTTSIPIGLATNASTSDLGCAPAAGLLAHTTEESPSSLGAVTAFNLGTGWGREKPDAVNETFFERSHELATLEIYYDDAAGLSSYGIQLTKAVSVSAPAFPVAFGGFCKPPTITV